MAKPAENVCGVTHRLTTIDIQRLKTCWQKASRLGFGGGNLG